MLMYLTIIDSKEGQQKFEFIYNRYKKLMFYIANKILGDTRDSEDTVHDAFLKIIEIIDDIKDVESPQTRSLIVTITENKAIDLYRKRQRKTVLPFEEEYLGVPNCSDIESVEDNEVVTKAIASLSGKYREVLFLKYSHGYSIDEMALILSMSKENVKKTIQRARRKLEQALKNEGQIVTPEEVESVVTAPETRASTSRWSISLSGTEMSKGIEVTSSYLDILCYNGLPVCESCERVNRYTVIFLNILTYPL